MQDFNGKVLVSSKLADRYSRYLTSPVQRLKLLDSLHKITVGERGRLPKLFSKVPFVGSLRERALIAVEVAKLLPGDRGLPLNFRILFVLYRLRLAVYALCLIALVSFGAGVIYTCARVAGTQSFAGEANAHGGAPLKAGAAPAGGVRLGEVETKAGLPLSKVWLADKGSGFEFYSNGARVLTEFSTNGPERKFYRFHFSGPGRFDSSLMTRPVGIVFHVSESDVLPFSDQYNSSLNVASRGLLEYARDHRLYNYVIDRFGRIYRIVGDEYQSNHAGISVWGAGQDFYVNLSAGYIGVCFEGKYAPGQAVGPDDINEAQIYAARVLTAVLRSKYGIDDANCVTHGLVSVNPSNHLLGYHTDWVSGFPFEAVGISDKYSSEMIAVSKLGFLYDRAYLAAAGGSGWSGLDQAEARLKDQARAAGLGLDKQREIGWRIFRQAFDVQHELDVRSEAAFKLQGG